MRLSGQSVTEPRRERVIGQRDSRLPSAALVRSKLRVGALLSLAASAAVSLAVPLSAGVVAVAAVSVAHDAHTASSSVQHLDESLTQVLRLGSLTPGTDVAKPQTAAAVESLAPGIQALSTVAQQVASADIDYSAFAKLADDLQKSHLPDLIASAAQLTAHLDRLKVNQQISFHTGNEPDGLVAGQSGGERHAANPSP